MKSLISIEKRNLTAAEFQGLAEVPAELEWFANITNEKTRRAYKNDVGEFSAFIGIISGGNAPGYTGSCDRLA